MSTVQASTAELSDGCVQILVCKEVRVLGKTHCLVLM